MTRVVDGLFGERANTSRGANYFVRLVVGRRNLYKRSGLFLGKAIRVNATSSSVVYGVEGPSSLLVRVFGVFGNGLRMSANTMNVFNVSFILYELLFVGTNGLNWRRSRVDLTP